MPPHIGITITFGLAKKSKTKKIKKSKLDASLKHNDYPNNSFQYVMIHHTTTTTTNYGLLPHHNNNFCSVKEKKPQQN
jgi:hypothetical protein